MARSYQRRWGALPSEQVGAAHSGELMRFAGACGKQTIATFTCVEYPPVVLEKDDRKVHEAHAGHPDRNKSRRILGAYKKLLSFQFLGTIILAAILCTWLLIAHIFATQVPVLPLVIFMGVLGAFFSALMRLYRVDEAGTALISPTVVDLPDWHLFMYSFVPPLIGAIAAAVLYMIFMGKLVEGPLFPTLGCLAGHDCRTIQDLMQLYFPVEPADYGKTMVWSFIAGFSERLVPNLLQSIVTKQGQEPVE